eukprot:gb/GECG01016225.1/.p1 GENE.gb/GECG01016225.1/~~gb/GECG01016225.1/.p1  ORF type:complete len:143 (+),score=26.82 gb/GECG01016225.1/:1-429(+)
MSSEGNEKKSGGAYRLQEVAQHTEESDCWMVIHDKVYDVTNFMADHPGGPEILLENAGKDATDEFEDTGHSQSARKMLPDYYIGELHDEDKKKSSGSGSGSAQRTAGDDSHGGSNLGYLIPIVVLAIAVYLKFFDTALLNAQ